MSARNNMHNLTTLIKRSEAATSRLEDITTPSDVIGRDVGTLPESTGAVAAAGAVASPIPTAKAPVEDLPERIEELIL